jgi:hypothetical protein
VPLRTSVEQVSGIGWVEIHHIGMPLIAAVVANATLRLGRADPARWKLY